MNCEKWRIRDLFQTAQVGSRADMNRSAKLRHVRVFLSPTLDGLDVAHVDVVAEREYG